MNPAEKKQAAILVSLILVVLVGGGLWAKSVIGSVPAPTPPVEQAVNTPLNAAKTAENTVGQLNKVQTDANNAAQGVMNTNPGSGTSASNPGTASGTMPGTNPGVTPGTNTSAVGTQPTVGGNPFKTVLSQGGGATNESAAEAARRAAEANRATGAFSKPNNMGMTKPLGMQPLPDVTGMHPLAPPADAIAAFRVLGVISSEIGRLAVVRYGTETLYLQPGDKLSSGLRISRVLDNGIELTAKKFHKLVLVGQAIGEGAK